MGTFSYLLEGEESRIDNGEGEVRPRGMRRLFAPLSVRKGESLPVEDCPVSLLAGQPDLLARLEPEWVEKEGRRSLTGG